MKQSNIYFVGKAGSGKTTLSQYLIDNYNYQVAKFAYPVYMIAEKYFNMKNKNRRLLQVIGTEAGRDCINQDIWVNRFKEDITIVNKVFEIMDMDKPKFVMDDCRFPNEHKILQELNFVGIYLDVPEYIRKQRLIERDGEAQEDCLNHKSEILIDTFKDKLINLDNTVSIAIACQKLSSILKSF